MLSKKMTFSLMSLITLLAFAFVAPFATAGILGDKFATTITLESGTIDGTEVGMLVGDNQITPGRTTIRVVFGKAVLVGGNAADADDQGAGGIPAGRFAPEDIGVVAFNKLTGESFELEPVAPVSAFGTGANETPSTTEYTVALDDADLVADTVVLVTIAEGAVTNNDPADVITAGTGDDTLGGNAKATLKFDVVAEVGDDDPRVVSVTDLPGAVIAPGNPDTFTFVVTLSEKPKEFKKAHIDAANTTVATDPIALAARAAGTTETSTEDSGRVYPYLVTVTPKYESKDDIVIKIKSFEDTETPTANKSLVSMGYVVKVLSDANKKVGLSGNEEGFAQGHHYPGRWLLGCSQDGVIPWSVNPGDPKKGAADISAS